MPNHRLPVVLAINDYDHVRDLASGVVPVEGVTLNCLHFSVEEIFFRFTKFREWDASELSLAKYCSLRAAGDDSLVAVPVFISRAFRHSAIFVRDNGPVDDPAALAGGRIGIPEWTQTATVYARGILEDEFGVGLRDVTWIQAGTNEPGRIEGVAVTPPDGVTVEARPDDTLNDLLLAGEVDAVIAAHPPTEFLRGTGRIVRLFSNYREREEEWYQRTGVFPIMHVLTLRADFNDRHPWVAMNLVTAFEAAKRRSLDRMRDFGAPRIPVPWAAANNERARSLVADDPWPYGIEPNRTTLNAFLDWAVEQGVCARRLEVEDLFVSQVQERFAI
jgi:4,5-dihydroxyphthalate decarboxylase